MATLAATTRTTLSGLLEHRYERKIGNNTVAQHNSYNDSYFILLHGHRIVTLLNDGSMTFSMCGYPTVTTRERINHFLDNYGFRLHQQNYEQYLRNLNTGETCPIGAYTEYLIKDSNVFDTGHISGVQKDPIKVL